MSLNNKLDIIITLNKTGALKDDIVNCNIKIKNISTLDINDIEIKCILPSDFKFYGNLTLNGTTLPNQNVSLISIGTLATSNSSIISFNLKIISLNSGKVIIKALGNYSYLDLSNTSINEIEESNECTLTIYKPNILITQSLNKELAKIGDSVIYTITLVNSGDIDINNLVLIDYFPNKFNIQVIKVDDVIDNSNIESGLIISNITRGETKQIIIYIDVIGFLDGTDTFINKIITNFDVIPDENFPEVNITKTITDINKITIVKHFASLTKKAYINYQSVGSTVEYFLTVTNDLKSSYDNSTLYDVIISDTLAPELKFIPESLKIDNVRYKEANILQGVNIGNLNAKENVTITFLAKILSQKLTPINNFAILEYKFIMNNSLPLQTDVLYSNSIEVISQITDITVIKSANKTQASLNDEIIYTVTIENTSDVDIIKAVFKDILPNSINLIDGSFKIDNILINSVELSKGVVIGPINLGEQKTISYKVSVDNIESSGKIENTATVDYIYKFINNISERKSKESNKIIIDVM